MMSNSIQSKINEMIKLFDDSKEKIDLIRSKFKEIEQEIFRANCLKPYLDSCEPFYCTYRITNQCKYFDALTPLIEIKQSYNI